MSQVRAYEPREVDRRTEPVDVGALDKVHARLRKVSVVLDPDPSSTELRTLFADIRGHRNTVSRIFGTLFPRLARYRADVVRVESLIAAESAQIVWTGKGLALATNEKARTARIRVILSEHHEAREELREDVIGLEALVAHAKHVQDELRSAFEEASRGLASIELEYRIERGAP